MALLLAAYPIAWIALSGFLGVATPQVGVAATLTIISPHLFLAGLLLLPVAVLARRRVVLVAFAAYLFVGLARFGTDWVSLPSPGAGEATIHVLSWNVEGGAAPPDEVVEKLLSQDADVVGLQELRPAVAEALQADPRVAERFPYRLLYPDRQALGLGLLSRYPLEELARRSDPVALVARVLLDETRELLVLNAHPLPGNIGTVGFDGRRRDRELAALRPTIDDLLSRSDPVLVLGDYNVAPEEPGYQVISAGLRDAHREAGFGPGWTWRPRELKALNAGFVRIDYVFTGPALGVVATSEDCGYAGDHCLLRAALRLD